MEKSDLCSQIPKPTPMPNDPFSKGVRGGGGAPASSKSDLAAQIPKPQPMGKSPFGGK